MDQSELLTSIYTLQKEATKVALAEMGLVSPRINQSEAHRIYKRVNVELWLELGLLKPVTEKSGKNSTIEYLREDLIKLSMRGASIGVSACRPKGTRRNKVK